MKEILIQIENYISGFMRPVKDFIINGFDIIVEYMSEKEGAFIVLLLGLIFVGIIFIIGLFRFMRKAFKLFLFLLFVLILVTAITIIFG